MENPNNRIVAAGRLEDGLTLSHEVMNEPFYTGTLLVKRLSGAVDRLPVTIPGKLLDLNGGETSPRIDQMLLVSGQVRSYNKVVDGSGRLMVTLFVQSMSPAADAECAPVYESGAAGDGEFERRGAGQGEARSQGELNMTLNKVNLVGVLCKPPIYRSTPFGREICDMMLAVNRAFGKSDYIPCIAWGRNAQYAARFRVGDRVRLSGRLQSREYQKLLENGEYMVRNAYEVSAFTLEAAGEAEGAAPMDRLRAAPMPGRGLEDGRLN